MAVTKKKPSAGLRPSAGSMILSSLGMTDLELAAFLPKNAPPQVRGVFGCDFETKLSLPEIASALKKVKGIASVVESEDVELPVEAGIMRRMSARLLFVGCALTLLAGCSMLVATDGLTDDVTVDGGLGGLPDAPAVTITSAAEAAFVGTLVFTSANIKSAVVEYD